MTENKEKECFEDEEPKLPAEDEESDLGWDPEEEKIRKRILAEIGDDPAPHITPEELNEIFESKDTKLIDTKSIDEKIKRIKKLTPELAKIIINKYKMPILNLSGVEEMDEKTIKEVIKFGEKKGLLRKKPTGRALWLNGLKTIETKEAEILGEFEGDTIMLNGLTSLDVETARALAKFEGKQIFLNGIKSITVEVAKELANSRAGGLMLGGIKEIGEKEAANLTKFRGNMLSLSGLEEVEFGAARELRDFERRGGTLDVSRYIRKIMEKA